jgi:hypothetical protein
MMYNTIYLPVKSRVGLEIYHRKPIVEVNLDVVYRDSIIGILCSHSSFTSSIIFDHALYVYNPDLLAKKD